MIGYLDVIVLALLVFALCQADCLFRFTGLSMAVVGWGYLICGGKW